MAHLTLFHGTLVCRGTLVDLDKGGNFYLRITAGPICIHERGWCRLTLIIWYSLQPLHYYTITNSFLLKHNKHFHRRFAKQWPPYIWCVQLTTKKVMRFLYLTKWPHVKFHRPLKCFCTSFKEKESSGPNNRAAPGFRCTATGRSLYFCPSLALWLLLKNNKSITKTTKFVLTFTRTANDKISHAHCCKIWHNEWM